MPEWYDIYEKGITDLPYSYDADEIIIFPSCEGKYLICQNYITHYVKTAWVSLSKLDEYRSFMVENKPKNIYPLEYTATTNHHGNIIPTGITRALTGYDIFCDEATFLAYMSYILKKYYHETPS
jgi:hypothetical protein